MKQNLVRLRALLLAASLAAPTALLSGCDGESYSDLEAKITELNDLLAQKDAVIAEYQAKDSEYEQFELDFQEAENQKAELEIDILYLENQIASYLSSGEVSEEEPGTEIVTNQMEELFDIVDLVNRYGLSSYSDKFTTLEGKVCRKVNTEKGSRYADGILNMITGEFEIPCETYVAIGDEFTTLEGKVCRKVNTKNGSSHGYADGILNMTTGEFEIPCETYVAIGDEFTTLEGKVCRWVTPPDNGYWQVCGPASDVYANGLLNMTTGEFEIPCKTYTYVSDEFEIVEGKICRWVRNTYGYAWHVDGLLNMTTGELEIPCETYVELKDAEENADYLYIGKKEDNTLDKLVYKSNSKTMKY